MSPQDWSRIQQGIFAGESGGDYGALFGYQNRPNGRFSGVDLTKMTVDQALEFANPSGPYGQYVKGQVGRVATPMGAYQIVGTTLRAAKEGLGLRGDEVLTPAMQDKLGQWIYKTQGTGAWEGYKPMTDAQAIAAETMSLLGQGPQTSTKGPQMMQEQKPQGLLGSLGIQKMEEGAEGETGQRFYNRDSFKDTAAILAQGFGRMGIMGMEEIADQVAKQRTENKARNKTIEMLGKMGTPQAASAIEYIKAGGSATDALKMVFTPAKDDRTAMMKNYEFFVSKGMSPEQAMTAVKSGNTINMGDVGDGNFLYGAKAGLEQGWRLDKRTGQASVIPGGPAEVEAEKAAAEAERRQSALDAQTGQTGSVIDSKVDSLVGMLEKDGIFDLPEAGIFGNALGSLGINQEARTFRNEIKAIQSIIAFDQLAKMRAASKTGAALGAVTEKELDLLMSAYGSLDQSTDPKVLAQNLRDIKRVMGMIENEPAARQFYYGQGGSSPAQTQSNGVSVGEPY